MSFISYLLVMSPIFITIVITIGFLLRAKFQAEKEKKKLGKIRIIEERVSKDETRFIVEQYSRITNSGAVYNYPTWQTWGVFDNYFKALDCLFDLKEAYNEAFGERNRREVIYESD